jgi:hypothetical protein
MRTGRSTAYAVDLVLAKDRGFLAFAAMTPFLLWRLLDAELPA